MIIRSSARKQAEKVEKQIKEKKKNLAAVPEKKARTKSKR